MAIRLVNDSSIQLIADAIKARTGRTNSLVFPDDFVFAINNALQPVPETVSIDLGFEAGEDVGSEATEFVRVGHNSSSGGRENDDAVWSFKTPNENITITDAEFELKWDGTDAGGWKDLFDYVFVISTSGDSGMTAYQKNDTTDIARTIVAIGNNDKKGTETISFEGLSLEANTTYYLRANFNGTTLETMKPFYKSGNTVELTQTINYPN